MNITLEQLQQLARVYNTLLTISTTGENTIVMADCLRALKKTIEEIDSQGEEEAPAAAPEVVME